MGVWRAVSEARTLAGNRYRLITLPSEPTADREFAALLRSAEETMAAVAVASGSELVDATVGDLGATVVAVKPTDESVDAVPPGSRPLSAGDLVDVVASPATIRQLEERAAAT